MKQERYVPAVTENADYNLAVSREFELNFQRAILLSLMEKGKLTQNQFKACVRELERG